MSGEDWGAVGEGREEIIEWREKRLKLQARMKSFHGFYFDIHDINMKLVFSFINSFSYMVVIHMALAAIAVYLATRYKIYFHVQMVLLVPAVVFPLGFAINTDLRRRDTVLKNVAHFQSHGMVLYSYMSEWRSATGFDVQWLEMSQDKMKSLLFLLREYLFTSDDERKKFILNATYEDIGDVNDMLEQIRISAMPGNGPLLQYAVNILSGMCLAFERIHVLKEYRSPRAIRSFNRVVVMLLPLILAPYFASVGRPSATEDNSWAPYFTSIIVASVFATLQAIQDTLDDPFDGVGEDDIQLDSFGEWTSVSFDTLRKQPTIFQVNCETR